MKQFASMALFVATVSFVPPAAYGHGGEDHGAPPPPVTQNLAPRAVAATKEFEIVAAVEGKQLAVYVDRFASNEPVANAKVEVEGGGLKGMASESAPGTYLMNITSPIPPGKHALTISVEAGESSDLLSATLEMTEPLAAEAHPRAWNEWAVWTVAALLLAASGVLLALRRNRASAKGKST